MDITNDAIVYRFTIVRCLKTRDDEKRNKPFEF